jgi:hypothetical protein
MGFLAPYMLWGAVAAGIPIALHFFFRSRYRTVPWAAMKFLLTSIEQTSRRLRFQELLLLIARVTLLVLLALALARPLTSAIRGAGQGDAVDAVFVFDTSYSMGASDGAVNRLDRAKTTALNLIDRLPPHSTVQVVTCADRAALLGPRSPANLDQARILIQNLELSHLATDLFPGVTEAAAVLQRGLASNKELYLFSDMQKLGFEQKAQGLVKTLQDLREKAAIYMVRAGTRKIRNVAVVGITPQSGIPRPGERVGFGILVRNNSTEEVRDLEVSLTVDADPKNREASSLGAIGPGETRAVTLTGKLEKPGLRLLSAALKHDDLEADNHFDQVILVRDQVSVLVVDGGIHEREPEKSSSFFLMHALLPVKDTERAKYHLQPRLIPPRLASPAMLAKQDLCILVNVALENDLRKRAEVLPGDFVEELGRFVRQGHGLLVFAGENTAVEAYNRVLGDRESLLPLKIAGLRDFPTKSPLLMDRTSMGLPAFWKFKEDEYYKGINNIEVYRTLDLQEPKRAASEAGKTKDASDQEAPTNGSSEAVNVILRYANGKPAVVSRKVDAGEVLLFATSADLGWKTGSADPTWTNWPILLGMYVPFLDASLSHLLHGQTQNHNLVAGQTLNWYPSDQTSLAYTLVQPDGKEVRLGLPEKVDDRPVLTATDLPKAGIYRLKTTALSPAEPVEDKSKIDVPLGVVPDLRESDDLETLTNAQLDERLEFQPIHLTAGDEAAVASTTERTNREWTMWILILVLLLALGESALAWWCGSAW